MAPTLDRYLNQWRFYRRSLMVFLALNIFSVVVALLLAAKYFGSQKNFGEKQRELYSQITSAEESLKDLRKIQATLKGRTRLEVKTLQDEKLILDSLSAWQKIREKATVLKLDWPKDFSPLIDTSENRTLLAEMTVQLEECQALRLKALAVSLGKYESNVRQLILAGLMTLMFGFIFPSLFIYLIGRALNRVRVEMQKAALEFIRGFNENRSAYGADAFKNVEFWLQILLLMSEQARYLSGHPVALMTSEISYVIRQELKKSQNNSKAA